jgi:hypothetical protein
MRSLLAVLVFVVLCIVWLAVAHAAPGLDLGEPQAPPVRVVVEDGPSPLYYRLHDDTLAVAGRTSLGAAIRDGDGAFEVSALAGVATRFGRGANTGLWAEAGYSYERFHEHLFVVGVGPALRGTGPLAWNIMVVPHAVIGHVDGETGYGMRTSFIASWLYGIEIAHQMMYVGSRREQEIQISFTAPWVIGR